jgi:hypothetical protein
MKVAKIVNLKANNGEIVNHSNLFNASVENASTVVSVIVPEGNFKARIVALAAGEIALFKGQTAIMEEVKRTIDAAYADETEKPAKGTEYRKIVYCALKESGRVVDTLKNEMESGSDAGKFLKRLSDYIRNNYETKAEKPAKGAAGAEEGGEAGAEGENDLTTKRTAALATVAALFEGNASALELIAALQAMA